MIPPPPQSTLFPYTTLFRSTKTRKHEEDQGFVVFVSSCFRLSLRLVRLCCAPCLTRSASPAARSPASDRKSTRLNSSHLGISYAVFCLKKKKNNTHINKLRT